MKLAVIPARGGSKRIPKKNIREFCGQPIIKYSIDAAIQSGVFDRVIVSTDCQEVSVVARNCGAEVPFVRPPELSGDHTPTFPVVRHSINWVSDNVERVTHACCIYATAPFLRAEDLAEGYTKLAKSPNAEFAFSVTSYAFSIFRSLRIEDNRVSMFWPEFELTRSQDLPEAYHDAGQFYWGTRQAFIEHDGFLSPNSIPVVLPRHRVQDIDTLEDWDRAEAMFSSIRLKTRE